MNKQESDVLSTLLVEPFINQRILAEGSGHSLGVVNRSLKELIKTGYLNESIRPTMKAISEFKEKTPQQAIILAAGFGMRMVPINTEMPKGLLEVNGEPLIERIIKQLHEVGIQKIYVVVGFMKEKYEYLMDEYGVELVVNSEYASKNNLHSVKLVKDHLQNSYIIPCDPIIKNNERIRIASEEEGQRIIEQFRERSDEIKKPGFVEENYKRFAASMLPNYISTFLGRKMLHRILAKVFGSGFYSNYYDKKTSLALLNYMECEAHHELICAAMSSLNEH